MRVRAELVEAVQITHLDSTEHLPTMEELLEDAEDFKTSSWLVKKICDHLFDLFKQENDMHAPVFNSIAETACGLADKFANSATNLAEFTKDDTVEESRSLEEHQFNLENVQEAFHDFLMVIIAGLMSRYPEQFLQLMRDTSDDISGLAQDKREDAKILLETLKSAADHHLKRSGFCQDINEVLSRTEDLLFRTNSELYPGDTSGQSPTQTEIISLSWLVCKICRYISTSLKADAKYNNTDLQAMVMRASRLTRVYVRLAFTPNRLEEALYYGVHGVFGNQIQTSQYKKALKEAFSDLLVLMIVDLMLRYSEQYRQFEQHIEDAIAQLNEQMCKETEKLFYDFRGWALQAFLEFLPNCLSRKAQIALELLVKEMECMKAET